MYKVDNAIHEFGLAPRDVYNGIFNLPGTREEHANAMAQLSYLKLTTLVEAFSRNRKLDNFSHRIVAVHPSVYLDYRDKWVIDFKSVQIER